MATIESKPSAHWNAGGWFGSQFGCTAFLLSGFVQYLATDSLMACFCFVSFAALNAWGFYLWSIRDKLTIHAGLQRFAAAAAVVLAILIIMVNRRGLTEPIHYWVIGFFPAIMLFLFLQEKSARWNRRSVHEQ